MRSATSPLDGLRLEGLEQLQEGEQTEVEACIELLLARAGVGPLGLGVLLVDDKAIRELNAAHRGLDKPTDVLSFAAHDGEAWPGLGEELGDLVVSVPTARRQAAENGHSLAWELMVLIAHGLLHLCGFDHERGPAEARAMCELEVSLLDLVDVDPSVALIGR